MVGESREDIAVIVEGVVKIYESRGERVVALREVGLAVARGEVLAIMGPSGSGKTTLLNIIAGIDRPNAGRVVVDGFEVSGAGEEELRRFRLERVGYVFQQHNLIPTLTALENILLPMSMAGRPSRSRGLELLKKVGLEGKEGRYPEELSGGEQQRLAVAVALANDPPIIVADEPTGELDIATGERIVRILLEEAHGRGKTVVLTTHDPRVARMADRVAVLEDGRLRGIYSPQRIAGGAGLGEVEAEKAVEAALRKMMEEARLKLREAEERFRRGEIGIDELINIYTRSRALEEAVREELSRLGVTA